MAESRLEAARRAGNLAAAIGALREEARTTEDDTSSEREQVNEVDGAIRLATHFAAAGTKQGPERREAMRDVRPGVTIGAKGAVKTKPTREQTFARTKEWASSLTDEQREAFMTGERYVALSESAQELIADVFAEVENDAYSTPVDVSGYDFEADPVDIDSLPEDETESPGDSFEVLEGEDVKSFDIDDAAPWEGDVV